MSKTFLKAAIAAAFIGAGLAGAAQAAPIVTNGSFEDTTGFVPDGNDTMVLHPGSTTMTGWTVVVNDLAWIGPTNPFGVSASQGSYFLDLTSYSDSCPCGGVTQTISTPTAGTYQLKFDLGSSGSTDSITAHAGSSSQAFTNVSLALNTWTTETLNFLSTGATTTITLDGTFASGDYIGLDNVIVTFLQATAVPEPASLALFGAALIGFGAFRRRKKAA